MSNLLATYHNAAHRFGSPFKMEDKPSFSNMDSSVKVGLERNESIHSGHFMVSEIEESELEKSQKQSSTESDYEREEETRMLSDYDFHTKDQNTHTYSVYGSRASVQIDGSLAKLFECMSLAYNGKITSPKWRTFKGLKLPIKDKIRLNNIIWRAWHIQYIAGRNPVVCQFSSSVDSQRHKRIEAILLEGKYWKRRINAVQEEYKKWRMFHHKPSGPFTPSDIDWESSLPRWSTNLSNIDHLFTYEENGDFFSSNYIAPNSLGNYYDYNSRDIARSGMGAQFMQPGLQQLQPNVDFMDTFEPIHDYISRIEKNNFSQLPTLQEEASFDVNINKEQEDFCLFVPNPDQTNTVIENTLTTKPMVESNTYQSTDMFRTSNEMLNLNAKLDSNAMMQPQQQQSQGSVANFDPMAKLELTNDYSNYSSQLMVSNNPFGSGIASLADNSAVQLSQTQVVKPSMALDSMYTDKPMSFESNATQVNTTHNLNNNRSVQSGSNTMFMSRFQPMSTINQAINQTLSETGQSQMNVFQPETTGMFYNESESLTKTNDKNKYPYVPYYSSNISMNAQSVSNSVGDVMPKMMNQNRIRSKSITMSQVQAQSQAQALNANLMSNQNQPVNKAIVTIKSLLNKPSLVSTMNASESSFVGNNNFRMPNHSGNIERSLSLPIYSHPDRQNKSAIASNNQLILQRIQANDAMQNSSFDSTSNAFDPNANVFYPTSVSATTSPMSNASSSFSNRDSHLLPQHSNHKKPQPTRKISHPEMSYASKADRMSDSQLNHGNLTATSVGLSSHNSNLITNLLQVNARSLNQNNVFNPHPSASSSSSSPNASLESSKTSVNTSFALLPLNQPGMGQSQFNSLSNRLKLDLNHKDPVLDLKSNRTKSSSTNVFSFGAKEKDLLDDMSTNMSGSYSPTELPQSSSGHELSFKSFKHMSSGALSSSTLSALGLPVKSEDRNQYRERRRVCHINAEQKRRCNIKNGFDTLRNLLPSLSSNVNTKISKAAMLQKAADYIRILKSEKYDQQKEYEMLRQQVERLNQTISVFQNQLPATGAPVTGQRSGQIKEQYVEYVHTRTLQNWKFWIFSIIMESLLDSYCNTVATTNVDEMCKTLNRWFDQNCCLITLRRDVLNSLRFISTSTNILTHPEALPDEAILAVTKGKNSSREDSATREFHKKFTGL